VNQKQAIKLGIKADKMYEKYSHIASKVKPGWKEPVALELMLRMSGYYDLIDKLDCYQQMRILQTRLKENI
tara:strand:+ start:430 stop:642 length:213 start_codon:yes stop_codon:yes gene_type:complete